MTVNEVKTNFRSLFPLLKIEFYQKKHDQFEGSSKTEQIGDKITLGKINTNLIPGETEIHENMTVEQFESMMRSRFGLNIQVFRKSGDQWLQTSITDNWTLKKQSKKAEELGKYLAK